MNKYLNTELAMVSFLFCVKRTCMNNIKIGQASILTLFLSLALLFSGVDGYSQSTTKNGERISFDANWKFIQEDVSGAQQINFKDASWRTLNLPHDWSIEGEYNENNPMGAQCGYLPAGFGWYRETITVPQDWKGKHIEIAFDGVFMNSTVWANGKELGTRP